MTGQAALNVINGNFTELYGNLQPPVKLLGVNANTQQAIPAGAKVVGISISGTAGAPVLRIGITANGTEILPDTSIGNSQDVQPDEYFQNAGNLYFTLSGGTVNIRIDIIPNFYN